MGLRARLVAALLLVALAPVAYLGWRAEPIVEALRERSAVSVRERAAAPAADWLASRAGELAADVERWVSGLGDDGGSPFPPPQRSRDRRRLAAWLESVGKAADDAGLDGWQLERSSVDPALRDEREILRADGSRQRLPGAVPSGRPEWGWSDDGARLIVRFALESDLAGGGVYFAGERWLTRARIDEQLAGVVGAPVRVAPFLPGRRYASDDILIVDAEGRVGGGAASTIVLEIDSAAPGRRAEGALRSALRSVMLGSAALAAALALLLAEVVIRPLRRLTVAVSRVAGGEPPGGAMPTGSGEVGRLASAVDAMIASLRAESLRRAEAERRGAWRDVARRVAHEVRNPLSPIRLAVDNVRRARARGARELDESLDAELPAIETEVARLDRLVREFSEYARLPSPEPHPVRLEEFVEPAVRGQVPDPGRITVDVRIDDGLERPVLVDAVLLGQALANLARNAVEALGERRGTIRVRCRPGSPTEDRTAQGFVIEMTDDGPGIPEEMRDTLFDPYVSGRGSSGLGLAITRRVIAEHGGTITVDEPPGGGARFLISLPAGSLQRGDS